MITMPLAGCYGGDDNTDSEENQSPVFYGENFRLISACPDLLLNGCPTFDNIYPSIVGNSMVLDYDGEVVSVGLDVDRDLIIDYEFSTIDNFSTYKPIGFHSINPSDFNPIYLREEAGQDSDAMCTQWVNIIAIDDDGAMTILPNRWNFSHNVGTMQCTTEPYDPNYNNNLN